MINKILVHLVAAFFLFYGISFSLWPSLMFHLVTGAEVSNQTALIDIRATYGGMSFAVAALLHFLALKQERIRLALYFVLLLMCSMALPRTLGMLTDGDANWIMYLYLTLEVLVGGIVIARLKLDKQR